MLISVVDLCQLVKIIMNGGFGVVHELLATAKSVLEQEAHGVFNYKNADEIVFPEAQAEIVTVPESGARVLLLPKNGVKYILGDIHGDYYALLTFLCRENILVRLAEGENLQVIFLGDLIDRGTASVEVLLTVYILKILFPAAFYFLQGNHETKEFADMLKPEVEVERVNGSGRDLYTSIREHFEPIKMSDSNSAQELFYELVDLWQYHYSAAFTAEKYMLVHGGIPCANYAFAFVEFGLQTLFSQEHLLSQMLWNDSRSEGEMLAKATASNCPVLPRFWPSLRGGANWCFDVEVLASLQVRFGINGLIRGHEVQRQGCKLYHTLTGLSLLSLFSTGNGSEHSAYTEDAEYRGCVSPKYFTYRPAKIVDKGVTLADCLPISNSITDLIIGLVEIIIDLPVTTDNPQVVFSQDENDSNTLISNKILFSDLTIDTLFCAFLWAWEARFGKHIVVIKEGCADGRIMTQVSVSGLSPDVIGRLRSSADFSSLFKMLGITTSFLEQKTNAVDNVENIEDGLLMGYGI